MYITPGRISQTIPIAIGQDVDTAASDPQPTIIRDNIVRTQFEVLTYTRTADGNLADQILDYTLVGCSCTQGGVIPGAQSFEPSYWNGQTYVRPEERINGQSYENPAGAMIVPARNTATPNLRQNDPPDVKLLCNICCRDHHDTPNADAPKISPWRPDGSRDFDGDGNVDTTPGSPDNHYLPVLQSGAYTFQPADSPGDEYYETCRFLRRDGEYVLTLDARLKSLVSLPDFLLDEPAETEGYADFAWKFVDEYVTLAVAKNALGGNYATGGFSAAEYAAIYTSAEAVAPLATQTALDPITPYALTSNGLQMNARGIFIDYMTPEVLAAIKCKDDGDSTSTACLPYANISRLELVPFYAVGMTKLVNWRPENAAVATVPLKDRNDPFSRGFAIGQGSGTTNVVADSPVSNISLTNPVPAQAIEVAQTLVDRVPVATSGGTPPAPAKTVRFSVGVDRDADLPNADVVQLSGLLAGQACTQIGVRAGRVDWTCTLTSLGQGGVRFDAYTGTECVRRERGSCVQEAPVRNVLCFSPQPATVTPYLAPVNAYNDYTVTGYKGSQVNDVLINVDVNRATDGC